MSDNYKSAQQKFNANSEQESAKGSEFELMKNFMTGTASGKFIIFFIIYFINVGIAYLIAKARQNKDTKVHKPLAKDVFIDGLLFLIAELVLIGGSFGISKSGPWTLLLLGPQLFQGLFTLVGFILTSALQQ